MWVYVLNSEGQRIKWNLVRMCVENIENMWTAMRISKY